MVKRVLIIGGYGNFGSYISRRLAAAPDIQVIIAGRNPDRAQALAAEIVDAQHPPLVEKLDIRHDLDARLQARKPDIVIHTSGPFQGQGYRVARACINAGAHYIDLSDGREFVCGINALDGNSKKSGVAVISGASSVPGMSSAVIDEYAPRFLRLREVDFGISTAQQTSRGLATTRAVLGYAGKKFTTLINGRMQPVYGWQGLRRHKYPVLGGRFLCDCDIPDLGLFPDAYPGLETIRFGAGTQLGWMHLGLWGMSWLVRVGLVKSLAPAAPALMAAARRFDWLASGQSAFHMTMSGLGQDGENLCLTWHLVARDNHGPLIPCAPAIVLARKLAAGQGPEPGARPCVGLVTLAEILQELDGLHIDAMLDAPT